MKSSTKRFVSVLLLGALICFSLPALSARADEFPTKPLTMIVPYRAGGSTDTMGRVLAKALKKELGQPVVVVNRTGGGGTVGATFLKNADPDGYTFLMGGDDITTWNPLVQKVEFTRDDFRYLAAVAEYQNGLICLKDKPYKTLAELIAYSKKHPGVRCATQTPMDKAILERIMEKEGVDWTIVSTTGGGEAMQLLFGGQIDISYSGGVHNQYLEKVTVLASFNKNRLAASKDKPSLKEMGYRVFFPSYVMFMTHVKVPEDVAKKLETAILKASQDKNFVTIVEERLKAPIIQVGSGELTRHIAELAEELKALKK